MELELEGGNSILIEDGSPTVIGRLLGLGLGPSSSDRTISRRHLSLLIMAPGSDVVDSNSPAEVLLQFEVIGKNPILVCSRDGECKRVLIKSEKGTLKAGDRISLSIKNPSFFVVKRKEVKKPEVEGSVLDAVQRRERRTQQRRKELDARARSEEAAGGYEDLFREESPVDIDPSVISLIDPVKELGFLVKGHEFDQYPRNKIRPFKDWNWFLEELVGDGSDGDDEDDDVAIKMKGMHQKRKKGGDSDGEEWTGDSQHQGVLATKAASAMYSTRSKDKKKPRSNLQGMKKVVEKQYNSQQNEDVDEDDETLGGFIVGDEEEDMNEVESEEEEEEDEEESDID